MVVKFNMTIAEVNISPTSAIERFHIGFDAQKALDSFSIHPSQRVSPLSITQGLDYVSRDLLTQG